MNIYLYNILFIFIRYILLKLNLIIKLNITYLHQAEKCEKYVTVIEKFFTPSPPSPAAFSCSCRFFFLWHHILSE